MGRTPTTYAPPPLQTKGAEPVNIANKKFSCPNCFHAISGKRAYVGKGNPTDQSDATDFTCPDCHAHLLLCCAVLGGLYFSVNRRVIDYPK
jgi:predicted RNA-binding Zn-ribbon protein involved in translation (DUF1610 family)